MRIVNKAFVFLLACVLLVSNCLVFAFAAGEAVITVGSAEGYPGDIVAVPISITALPKNGFASATFDVYFGENLEYVNAVQCEDNYGSLTFSRPSDAASDKNFVSIVCFSGLANKNYTYLRQLATVYFRIKSDALPTDDASENTVSVQTTDAIDKDLGSVSFTCNAGVVGIAERASALGEKLLGHSLTLDGEISLNFHVDVSSAVLSSDSAFVEYTVNGEEPVTVTEKLSECREDTDGNLMLSFSLPSPMWSRAVTARISDGNGNYGDSFTYSVKNYALYMLSGNYTTGDSGRDSALKELCVALLNYGGYSQNYFGYFSDSEDELANGNVLFGDNALIGELVTDEFDSEIRSDASAVLSGACSGISYYGVNVAVDAATAITHYFTVEGNAGDYEFTLTSSVADAVVLTPFEFDGKIAVKINDIPAAYLDLPYTVSVSSANGEGEVLSVTYSVRSYMAHNLDNADDYLTDLIRAMYLYGVAADAYFGR